MNDLLTYRKCIFSSHIGEDGILEYIFDKLVDRNVSVHKKCVEFGGHDGIFNSNTRNLIINHGWQSLQIEGDPIKSQQCQNSYEGYSAKTICCYVDTDKISDDCFDKITIRERYNKIDFVSIDVDGLDYEIFESISNLPTVISIEVSVTNDPLTHNQTPIEISRYDVGQGLTVMTDLANKKGYELLVYTGNAFYIKKEYYPMFDISDNSPEQIFRNHWNIRSPEDKLWLKEHCYKNNLHNSLMV